MADRAFGVKEINIVGSAGTPTISSPNNINLNGINVAISTDLQVGRNVSVVGVLTATTLYGDGSNLTGISGGGVGVGTTVISTESITVSGVSTFNSNVNLGGGVSPLQVYNGGQNILKSNSPLTIQGGGGSGPRLVLNNNTNIQLIPTTGNNGVLLYHGADLKLQTTNSGVSITGAVSLSNVSASSSVTAATFYGDGSGLTNLPGGGGGSIAGINTTGTSYFSTIDLSSKILSDQFTIRDAGDTLNKMVFVGSSSGHVVRLYAGGNEKLTTTSTGLFVQDDIRAIGVVSASSFVGDGSGLTNLPGGGGISTTTTSFFNTIHATGTIDIGTTNAGVAVTHMSIDTADVSGTIRNSIKSGAGNTNAVFDIETKEFLVTDPYAGKGALIAADSSGTKLFKDDSLKLQTIGTGVTVTGTMYATAFSGDGSGLTGVPISGTDGSFTRVDSQQIIISGLSTFQGNVYLGDNDVLNIGDTNDLQIWHTGSASVIRDSGTGELQIQSNGTAIRFSDTSGNKSALFNTNADTNLYYADALRIQTTDYGIDLTGTTQTDNLNVTGVSTFSTSSITDAVLTFEHTSSPSNYLQAYQGSNGTYNLIKQGTGSFFIDGSNIYIGAASTTETYAGFEKDGRVYLNYDDVTRFETTSTGAVVTGILTATGNMTVASNLSLEGDGTDSFIKETSATGELTISTNQLKIENPSFETLARFNENSDVQLYYDNNLKLSTTNTGVNISGITTSTSFTTNSTTGDGSDRGFTTKYYITADGSTSYRFAGPGVANTTANPTLYLHRGFTYIFENSTGSAHPFELRVSDGGAAWAPGNFLSGSINGTQVLTVPFDAQASIVYQCTLHSGMVGTINFVS